MAVFGWNNAIALVCGNTTVWKPAPTTSLCAIAVTKILESIFRQNNLPSSIFALISGGSEIGKAIAEDKRLPLVSFTGSTKVGREVGVTVQRRFGKHILELGGNNAILVCPDADIDMVIRATMFACAGTAGQRCTTTRRLFLHESIFDNVVARLAKSFDQLRVGNPLDPNTLYGPLHTKEAVLKYEETIAKAVQLGGKVVYGGNRINRPGNYVEPTIIIDLEHDAQIVHEETFAPILYVIKFTKLKDAITWNNEVDQGLSSSLFTQNMANIFEVCNRLEYIIHHHYLFINLTNIYI